MKATRVNPELLSKIAELLQDAVNAGDTGRQGDLDHVRGLLSGRKSSSGEILGKPSRRLPEGLPGKWTVFIDKWRPSSLNAIVNEHWGKAYRIKESDKEMLYCECWKAGVYAAKQKRWIGLEIGISGRQKKYDRDNAWKSFLDALTSIGVIVDDSEDWLDYDKPTWVKGQKTYTKITIRDID